MTNNKVLGQNQPIANRDADLYITPSGSATVVKSITVTNTSTVADTFDIGILQSDNGPVSYDGFVAVSFDDAFADRNSAYSTDGIKWIRNRMNPGGIRWEEIAYGNNVFVAVTPYTAPTGGGNWVNGSYSTNGITWTMNTMPSASYWNSVAYDYTYNSGFIAVGYPNAGAGSTDGITWTASTMPSNASWEVVWGDQLFVAVGGGWISAYTSGPGDTWTANTMPANLSWSDIAYGSGIYVAIARNTRQAAVSWANNWTSTTLPISLSWNSITYGNGMFVAVGTAYATPAQAAYSTDGITWTSGTLPAGSWYGPSQIDYANGTFIAMGYAFFATSTDLVTWTEIVWEDPQASYQMNWKSATGGTITLSDKIIPDEDYLFKSHDIQGNETITIKGGYMMESGNILRVKSTNGTSTFHAFGREI